MKRLVLAVTALAAFGWVIPAQATPITYEISGMATGQIGAKPFNGVEVDLIGSGDTTNVTSFLVSGLAVFANPFSKLTVTIGGVGTATITDPSEIWAVATPNPANIPLVVMGRIDAPPALNSITGIGIVGSNTLAGYDDTTGIGPITDEGGIGFNPACSTPGHDPCVHTTLGLLRFTSNIDFPFTTQATFTATTVPEPTTLLLLGSGIVTLAGRRFRRRCSTPNLPR
jgi:hypothetical protein